MFQTNAADTVIAQVRGPKGDPGDVSTAQLNAAIAALKSGVDPAGDTLAELYALILLRATLDGADLTHATATTQSAGNNSTSIATTAFTHQEIVNAIADVLITKGAANGIASLDGAGKLPTSQLPASVLGAVKFQATWNANTNTPAIPAAALANQGWYYIVGTAGATNVGGFTDWLVGDWLVSDGAAWDKIDNTDRVNSVAGLTGTITAAALKAAIAFAAADISDASANGRSLITAVSYAAMKTLLAITAADITNASANGRSLLTAADYAAMKTLLAITAADITDASSNGRSLITAASYAAMKTLLSLAKADVGLGNVDNTSDATKNSAAVTLTNKALTSPAITGGTHDALTSLGVRSTGAAFDLKIASSEVLTANHTLSVNLGNADRSLTLGGNPTINGGTHSGTNTGDQTITMSGDVSGSGTGAITTAIGANVVARAMQAQGVARSVIGVAGNATANVADIQGTASQFLGVNSAGTAVAFQTMSGDATMSGPAISVTKTGGVAFATIATSASASDLSAGTAAVARGGTGTGTAFTQGSVTFAGVSGVYSQDNANLFWDASNHRLGIGTAAPLFALHVVGASSAANNTQTGSALAITDAATPAEGLYVRIKNSGNGIGGASFIQQIISQGGNGLEIYTNGPAMPIVLGMNNAESARIAGGFSVGTTSDPGSGNLIVAGGLIPGSFTVATLPAGATGKTVWCSNCRAFNGAGVQEGAGVGTGCLVIYNSAAWKIAGTNITAAA
jgi:hypothetical protein